MSGEFLIPVEGGGGGRYSFVLGLLISPNVMSSQKGSFWSIRVFNYDSVTFGF